MESCSSRREQGRGFAIRIAKPQRTEYPSNESAKTEPANVLSAGKRLHRKTPERFAVRGHAGTDTVLSVEKLRGLYPVYNLTVEGSGEYYANGILVHNSWRYPEAWDMLMFGLRLGNPKAAVTTTPRPVKVLRELIELPTTVVVKGSSYENEANLA